jgi:hypothetical protein
MESFPLPAGAHKDRATGMGRRVIYLMFRRIFLKSALALPMARPLIGLSALGEALSVPAEATVPAKASAGDFDFVFFTDIHLGPKFRDIRSARSGMARSTPCT